METRKTALESPGIPEDLTIDDNKYNSPSDIANEVNNYFASISERLDGRPQMQIIAIFKNSTYHS